MDQIAQSGANRVYQDFEPFFEWTEDEASAILVVMLPGFTKEQLKVQVTSKPLLRINAERQIDNNTWRRFAKEFPIPSYCDSNEVSAKFERGILSVKFPKLITQESPIPQLPSVEPKAPQKKEKGEQVSDEKEQSKTEQEQSKTEQKEQNKTEQEQSKTKKKEQNKTEQEQSKTKKKEQNKTEQEQSKTERVAPRNEEAHEKAGFATPKDHEKPKAKKMPEKLKTRVLDFSVSLKSEDAKNGFCGKRNTMKWPKRVMNIVVAILLVMVLGMYVKNAFRSSDQGGSKFQEF